MSLNACAVACLADACGQLIVELKRLDAPVGFGLARATGGGLKLQPRRHDVVGLVSPDYFSVSRIGLGKLDPRHLHAAACEDVLVVHPRKQRPAQMAGALGQMFPGSDGVEPGCIARAVFDAHCGKRAGAFGCRFVDQRSQFRNCRQRDVDVALDGLLRLSLGPCERGRQAAAKQRQSDAGARDPAIEHDGLGPRSDSIRPVFWPPAELWTRNHPAVNLGAAVRHSRFAKRARRQARGSGTGGAAIPVIAP